MIEVEEMGVIQCDKCGDDIYQGEVYFALAVRCECGKRKEFCLCKECIQSAMEVNRYEQVE